MKKYPLTEQKQVLKVLADKIDDFYLAGGTALSLFYLNHRQSDDLDFFTHEFSNKRVQDIVSYIINQTGCKITEEHAQLSDKYVKHLVYILIFKNKSSLRLDFVEDQSPFIGKVPAKQDGIPILSLDDIYFRKLQTVSGLHHQKDEVGRSKFAGGGEEAKDLLDIFHLSSKHIPLSDFVDIHCSQSFKEGIIRWFRTFNRMMMITGLVELKTDQKIEFNVIDRHLRIEIDKILEREIELS